MPGICNLSIFGVGSNLISVTRAVVLKPSYIRPQIPAEITYNQAAKLAEICLVSSAIED